MKVKILPFFAIAFIPVTVLQAQTVAVETSVQASRPAAGNENFTWVFTAKEQEMHAGTFSEGLACVKQDGKWGYIDEQGNWVIQPTYADAGSFGDGMAPVAAVMGSKTKWGYINKKGVWVVNPKYDFADAFVNGYGTAGFAPSGSGERKTDILDPSGKVLFTKKFKSIGPFSEGLAAVQDGKGNFGYIDAKGEVVLPLAYSYASRFEGGMAVVSEGPNHFFINSAGKKIFQTSKDQARFADEVAPRKDPATGKVGFADKTGHTVIPVQYEDVSNFNEGYAAVLMDKQWEIITLAGEPATQQKFADSLFFGISNGMARFMEGNRYGFLDVATQGVIKPEYAEAGPFCNGYAVALAGRTCYLVSKNGDRKQLPGQYDVLPAWDGTYIRMGKGILKLQ